MTHRALPAPARTAHPGILGVGGYRPHRVVPNEEICRHIDSSDEWIRTRSGIRTRRWASAEETLVAMGAHAAGKALAQAGVRADQVDCVIVATFTHMQQTPAAAPMIADRIRIRGAAAFDVSAGCAGFVHALALAADAIRAGTSRYVLVVGAERMTDLLDVTDRSTAFLFGDGAGAVVLGPVGANAVGPVVWGADGAQADAIAQTTPWNEWHGTTGEHATRRPALRQDGQRVYRWAAFEMARVAQQALDAAGLTPADLDAFVPHQANVRIIDHLADRLRLPSHVAVARDVETTGNTSGASIPLALDHLLQQGTLAPGARTLLLGYGAGLSYAATVVTLP
ncbi:beta-ketoacyl-ACP synthase III [Streptomyces sp. NPDC047117]|uniref:beta-ketoacyl-ACP synthase III n=1 Tax=unclassified Streptomyces TaxID=2593676 RepID=UPI0033C4C00C